MKPSITSHLKLVPLEIHQDKKNFIVEDLSSKEFYEMTDVCIDAINLMNKNEDLDSIEDELKAKYPNDDIDLVEFASQLLKLGLVEEMDGRKIELKQKKQSNPGFLWISPRVGRLFFKKAAMYFYLGLFLVNLCILFVHPNLFPHYQNLFIFQLMALNIPAWLVLTFLLVLIHEIGHILAIRAYNLPTRLGIGHRLFLVVMETDMSSVWKLPSRDRNILYLAGLCFDTAILFVALAGQLIPIVSRGTAAVLQVIVLNTFIRMVYQLCFYMKTDLYFLFENSTGCYNLMENATALLRTRIKQQEKNSYSKEVVFEGERKIVLFYSIFYFLGVVLTTAIYIGFYIPQLLYAVKKVLPGFETSPMSLSFWDSAVFFIQLLIGFLLLVYSWSKKYRQED